MRITADYADYLHGPEWAAKKQQRMEMDGNRCQGCQAEESLLVHHVTYIRRGREEMDDLVTVCGRCHRLIHRIYKAGNGPSLKAVTSRVLRQMRPGPAEFTKIELPLVMPEKDRKGNWKTLLTIT